MLVYLPSFQVQFAPLFPKVGHFGHCQLRLIQALRCGTRRGHLIDPQRGALLQALQRLWDGLLCKVSSGIVIVVSLSVFLTVFVHVCTVQCFYSACNNSQTVELLEEWNGLVWAVDPFRTLLC